MKRTKMEMRQGGFTLMELVIAMAIFGLLIAICSPTLVTAYTEWNNQAAAEQIANNLTDMNQAATHFAVKNGTQAADIGSGAGTLVGGGMLTGIPTSPSSASGYTWDTSYTGWSSAAVDAVVKTSTASRPICSKFNELFAGGAAGADPPAAVNYGRNQQCFGSGPYTILMTMYQN